MIELPELSNGLLYLSIIVILLIWFISFRRHRRTNQSRGLSSDYFKGLDYLLNDEQGKALDIFVRLVESNWEIIDTHFALGRIFRKNGEIDKAIKIHQGLIARPSLPEKYRSKVLLELGYDYLAAGWFDRAEGLFKEVLIHDKKSVKARRNLILIYQQEKDWHKAIDIAVDLYADKASDVGTMISQYYCELAEIAKVKGDVGLVEHNAKQALHYDAASVRASMLLADRAMAKGNYKQAISNYEVIAKNNIDFFPLVIDQLIECYNQLELPVKLIDYLESVEQQHNSLALTEKHAMVLEQYAGRDQAIEYLTEKLKHYPSIQGMQYLLSYRNNDSTNEEADLLLDLNTALVKMSRSENEFKCQHCGFQANTLYWLCPGCQSWGGVKPTRVEAA